MSCSDFSRNRWFWALMVGVSLGTLTVTPGVLADDAALVPARGEAIRYDDVVLTPRRIINGDALQQTQTYANITLDTSASTSFLPMEPGDISYGGGDLLISPGLSYVPPVVTSGPAPESAVGAVSEPPVLEAWTVPAAQPDVVFQPVPPVEDVVSVTPTVPVEPLQPAPVVVASAPAYEVIPPAPLPEPMSVTTVAPLVETPSVRMGGPDGCAAEMGSMVRSGTLNLATGDLLADQLGEWARGYGYTMYWEADQYRAGGALSLNRGFDETLRMVRDALQQSGISLTMTIYNNCVVRVTEAK